MLILCNQKNEAGQVINETEYWTQYARFALKYNMANTAEFYLRKRQVLSASQEASLGSSPQAVQDRLTLAALYV